jgi:hypothetical protein
LSAIFSTCGTWRYRLDRDCGLLGSLVYAYFGVNCSKAGSEKNDQTVGKWIGFTTRNDGHRLIVGNPFTYVATDVRDLAGAADPIGPENDRYLAEIIAEADVLVPCWGNRNKLPPRLRPRLDWLRDLIFAAGKPVKILGLTASGDPKHPLMLGYDTPLVEWTRARQLTETPDA